MTLDGSLLAWVYGGLLLYWLFTRFPPARKGGQR